MDTPSRTMSARSMQSVRFADDTPQSKGSQKSVDIVASAELDESERAEDDDENMPLMKHVATLYTPRQIIDSTNRQKPTNNTKPRHSAFWSFFKDVDKIREQYPSLTAEEVSRAAAQLELVSLGVEGAATCNITFKGCLMFKNRPVHSATLLHFAIWLSSEAEYAVGLVEKLLEKLQNPDDVLLPAILPAGHKVTFVSALHIAAGLGLLDILERLADFVSNRLSEEVKMTPEVYVNTWAMLAPKEVIEGGFDASDATLMVKGEKGETEKQEIVWTEAYQAIHESTFQGHADVTLWLLSQGADATSKNNVNITPLHFVALCSISGMLESSAIYKLTRLIKKLIQTTDALEVTADMSKFLCDATNVTPFEVAVQAASKFPQECVGLLAPCLSNGRNQTYFNDINKIALSTSRGALNLVRAIAEKGKKDAHTLKCFRESAQKPGASDILASIFYTAPEAAAEMLELLEIEPEVEDSAHYPMPAHVSLWGLFRDLPMRCAYENDIRFAGKMKIPSWEWRKYKDAAEKWHDRFMPKAEQNSRKGHIKSVKVVTYLLPGILDIDIMMALTRLEAKSTSVMEKRSVEGAIFCLWENLIIWRWTAECVMVLYDMLALMTIAFFLHHVDHAGLLTLSLAAVVGQVVRSLMEFFSALWSVCRKNNEFKDDQIMANMWSPFSTWFLGTFLAPLGLTVLNILSLLSVELDIDAVKQRKHADTLFEKICFSAGLLMCCLQFVVMWRFVTIGSTIYTIRTTMTSGAVHQTIFIFGMLFISFALILLIWNKGDDISLILGAFRGWIFADGDGFNKMGMHHGLSTQTIFALFGAFFFNVMTLNIIIAVYGHEYDKAHDDRKFMFLKGRAHYISQSILSSYLVQWRGKIFQHALIGTSLLMIVMSIYMSLHFHVSISAGVILGVGERLLSVALMQCDWFSPEGTDSKNKQRFLWVCYSDDWTSWLGREISRDEQEQLEVLDEEQGRVGGSGVEPEKPAVVRTRSGSLSGRGGKVHHYDRIKQEIKQLEFDLERATSEVSD